MKTYNISPYYDDFDEFKNYHQILFRPGVAVQARELTQLQSILKNQIEKFGDHVFKQGSIVIPGNSYSKMDVDYIRLDSSITNQYMPKVGDTFIPQGSIGVGSTGTILRGIVIGVQTNKSAQVILSVAYTSAGVDVNGDTVFAFSPGDVLIFNNKDDQTSVIGSNSSDVGKHAVAFINTGVYYVNGTFVSVEKQSVIINPDAVTAEQASNPTASVILRIKESIVTVGDDNTLLDPAQGSYNYAAPGADRVKIELVLESINYGVDEEFRPDENIIEIMRFKEGVLLEHSNAPKYSELEKSLAKRTADESGDYVVKGFNLAVREALKLKNNGGVYLADTGKGTSTELDGKLVYTVSPGSAYIEGFGVDTLADTSVIVDKPRTATEFKKVSKRISYGNYVLVNATNLIAGSGIKTNDQVTFRDASGTLLGTATYITMDYYTGETWSASRVDKMYITDISLAFGSSLDTCATVSCNGQAIAKFVFELSVDGPKTQAWAPGTALSSPTNLTTCGYDSSSGNLYVFLNSAGSIPQTGTQVKLGTQSSAIFKTNLIFADSAENLIHYIGRPGVKSLKNVSGQSDIITTSWEKVSFVGSAVTSSAVSAGGIIIGTDSGIMSAYDASGPVPANSLQLSPSGTSLTRAPGGTDCFAMVQVIKPGAPPRKKTLSNRTEIISVPGQTRKVNLSKYDVVELESVIVESGGVKTERKNDFELVRNTSQFSYNNSYINLRASVSPLKAGDLVTIVYKYLMHDNGSTSNYFCADSYYDPVTNTQIPDYYIEKYTLIDGTEVSLRDCIDFRTTSVTSPVVSGSSLSTSIEFYLGRIDRVVVSKDGKIAVRQGIPALDPVMSVPQNGDYTLYKVALKPYVRSVEDVSISKTYVNSYTMQKIDYLSKRISNLEEFSLLNFSETQALQSNIIDANTGLNKFKTGYLVENFTDPFVVADVLASGYSASTSVSQGLYCGLNKENIQMDLYIQGADEDGFTYDVENKVLSQNFTEEVFASNMLSSNVVNINPFNIAAYSGEFKMEPSQDFWAETLTMPEVTIRRTGISWNYLPDTVPQIESSIKPNVQDTFTNGTAYTLPGNNIAYASGPSKLSIDTIMGWESRAAAVLPTNLLTEADKKAMNAGLVIDGTTSTKSLNYQQATVLWTTGRLSYADFAAAMGWGNGRWW